MYEEFRLFPSPLGVLSYLTLSSETLAITGLKTPFAGQNFSLAF